MLQLTLINRFYQKDNSKVELWWKQIVEFPSTAQLSYPMREDLTFHLCDSKAYLLGLDYKKDTTDFHTLSLYIG